MRSVPAYRLHQANSVHEGPIEKVLSGCLKEGRALLQINSDGSEEIALDGDTKLELGRELLHINGNRCLCAATLENVGCCPCPSFPRALSPTPSFMPGGPGGSCVQSWPVPHAGCVTHAELLTARSTPRCNVLGHLRTRKNQGKTVYLHRSAGPGG